MQRTKALNSSVSLDEVSPVVRRMNVSCVKTRSINALDGCVIATLEQHSLNEVLNGIILLIDHFPPPFIPLEVHRDVPATFLTSR